MQARIDRVAGTVNTWVVGDDDDVIVIDPGESAGAVMNVVGEREVLAVICTHGHARHVAAAFEVARRDEAPVALHVADLVAERLVRYARLVGGENVLAGTDCGLGMRVGHASICWAKLEALSEGARRATKILWG